MDDKITVDNDDELNLSNFFDLLQNEYILLSNAKIRSSIAESDFQQYKNAFRSTIASHCSYSFEQRNDEINYVSGTLAHFHCILVSHVLVDTLQIFKTELGKIKNHISAPVGLFEWRLVAYQKRINKKSCLDLILFMNEGVINAVRAKHKIDLQTIDNTLAAIMYELIQNNSFGYLEDKNKEINQLKNFITNSEICYNQIIYSKLQINNLFPFDEELNAIQTLKQLFDGEFTDTLLKYHVERRYVTSMNKTHQNKRLHHFNEEINKSKKIISDSVENTSVESCVTNEITNYYHFKITKLIADADAINIKYDQECEILDLHIGNMRIQLENMKNLYAKQSYQYDILKNNLNHEIIRRYRKKIAKKYLTLWRHKTKVKILYRLYNGNENLVNYYLMCELNGLPLPILPQVPARKNLKKPLKTKRKKK